MSPRARIVCIVSAIALLMCACSLVQPDEAEPGSPNRADRLARESKHAEAAAEYNTLAAGGSPQREVFQLRAVEEWIAAGNIAAAKQALAALPADIRTRQPTLRALVGAELALAQHDAAGAVRELDALPVPTQSNDLQRYWLLRGRAAFAAGRPLDAVRSYVERERVLPPGNAVKANRDELLTNLRQAAEQGASLKYPPRTDSIVAGWLDLAPVALELERGSAGASGDLARWRERYPQHPANDGVLPAPQTPVARSTEYPAQIALILPLSGRAEASGVAVRDGFIAAYLQPGETTRPHLRIYDEAAEGGSKAYERAVGDGATFIVGPLLKEDVAAIAPLAGKTPTLALNFLSDALDQEHALYQFSLLPEDEARAVARRVVADGRPRGVVLVPSNEFGSRVLAAFSEELTQQGGAVLDSVRYDATQADFSDAIRRLLQVREARGEPASHRTDANFIFVAGSPVAARLIRPQLKFHYAGDVPMYSTSDAFDADQSANVDMDGVIFPDMPWMISAEPATAQLRADVRAAWPSRAARRGRLYAFGFDAYRLVPALRSHRITKGTGISGLTGRLRLDERNRIRRDLDWAEIRGGVANPL